MKEKISFRTTFSDFFWWNASASKLTFDDLITSPNFLLETIFNSSHNNDGYDHHVYHQKKSKGQKQWMVKTFYSFHSSFLISW